MSDLKALPIACTLTPGDLRERLGAIQTLTRETLLGYERDGLRLALRYAPNAIERVRAMVTAEQHCCAFLEFDVREHLDAVHVTITAPQNARDAADELFEKFMFGVRIYELKGRPATAGSQTHWGAAATIWQRVSTSGSPCMRPLRAECLQIADWPNCSIAEALRLR